MYLCVEYITLYKSNCIFSPAARSTWARPFPIMWCFSPHISHKAPYMEEFDQICQNEKILSPIIICMKPTLAVYKLTISLLLASVQMGL